MHKHITKEYIEHKDRLCAVLQVTPIAFYDLPKKKKEKIVEAYGKWIASVDYPLQITARTINEDVLQQVDVLQATTEAKLKQQKKTHTLEEFQVFCDWLRTFIQNECQPGRWYFVVVPSYDKDSKVLEKRVEHAKEGLKSVGLNVKRLTNTDLHNIFSSYFNAFLELNKKTRVFAPSKSWLRLWRNQK